MADLSIYIGTDMTNQLVEIAGSPSRAKTLTDDTVTRKYKTLFTNVDTLIPGIGSSRTDYPNHFLSEWSYARTGEGTYTEVTLIYKVVVGSIINPTAPLPPDEVEYIAGTTRRHLGTHPSYAANKAWLGTPKTTPPGGGTAVDDPLGQPTVAPTKPGVSDYLIPTGVYRRVTYSHSQPALSIQSIATRNIPPGESGANRWLLTGYTLKIVKGVYQLSQEWTFLPIGTWDPDIYN